MKKIVYLLALIVLVLNYQSVYAQCSDGDSLCGFKTTPNADTLLDLSNSQNIYYVDFNRLHRTEKTKFIKNNVNQINKFKDIYKIHFLKNVNNINENKNAYSSFLKSEGVDIKGFSGNIKSYKSNGELTDINGDKINVNDFNKNSGFAFEIVDGDVKFINTQAQQPQSISFSGELKSNPENPNILKFTGTEFAGIKFDKRLTMDIMTQGEKTFIRLNEDFKNGAKIISSDFPDKIFLTGKVNFDLNNNIQGLQIARNDLPGWDRLTINDKDTFVPRSGNPHTILVNENTWNTFSRRFAKRFSDLKNLAFHDIDFPVRNYIHYGENGITITGEDIVRFTDSPFPNLAQEAKIRLPDKFLITHEAAIQLSETGRTRVVVTKGPLWNTYVAGVNTIKNGDIFVRRGVIPSSGYYMIDNGKDIVLGHLTPKGSVFALIPSAQAAVVNNQNPPVAVSPSQIFIQKLPTINTNIR